MTVARDMVLRIPALRRLYQTRNELLEERGMLLARLAANEALAAPLPSPFFHYNACFDPQAVMRRHAATDLRPHSGYLTNFLGVVIDPKFFPNILFDSAGKVEPIPIPANWHADIAEWGAALRAVDLARDSFTMIELGCGWGCWMNNTGIAARRMGLAVHLIGVEGDAGHVAFAHEACAVNGFTPSEITLHRAIIAAQPGIALFPRQARAGVAWGLEPIFDASEQQREAAVRSGDFEAVPAIPLADLISLHKRIDLLHVDIQGGEVDLIDENLAVLREKFAYLVIGTHSRKIEGDLFDLLLKDGWHLEIERPAILSLRSGVPQVSVDGVQGWRNPALLPDAA